jgi:hypothetical protein
MSGVSKSRRIIAGVMDSDSELVNASAFERFHRLGAHSSACSRGTKSDGKAVGSIANLDATVLNVAPCSSHNAS